ncbi:reverse transcriptase domain-containing protein [Serratia odorifera]|uniref:reverse transcriptase domain-containing protein n=1 Tax=Serratia odorifera TaxID=618 RepID=UPI0024118E28|nr:reverse transcriptase domain-containing protein [Serratia odorifera]
MAGENTTPISWERYADDSIIHCRSRREAGLLLSQLRERMKACGLELHPEKTRIVNCHPLTRRKNDGHYSFDFLGFTFRRRAARKIAGGSVHRISTGDKQ